MSDRHPLIYNEFDIEAARNAGKSFEQERIIKLLEADPEGVIPSGGGLRAGYETAIALIKGEK